jgi:thiamine-phosphate pyrophosphorylase
VEHARSDRLARPAPAGGRRSALSPPGGRPGSPAVHRPPFRLLAISNFAALDPPPVADWCRSLAAAGVEAIQLREKHLADGDLYRLALAARTAFPRPGRLLINGRLDVALAAGADGVHAPADGLPAAALRRRLDAGPEAGGLLGVSTHSLPDVTAAHHAGADFVVFGPVWASPGKAGPGTSAAPAGVDALRHAAAVGIPVYALGGVTLERFSEAAAAGAAGVAAIRLFQRADLEEVVAAASLHFPRAFGRGELF